MMKKTTPKRSIFKLLFFVIILASQASCGTGDGDAISPGDKSNIEEPPAKNENSGETPDLIQEEQSTIPPGDKVKPTNPTSSNTTTPVHTDALTIEPSPVLVPDTVFIKDHVGLMEGRISYRIPDSIKVNKVFIAAVMVSDTGALEKHLIEETAKYSAVGGEKIALKEVRIAEIQIGEIMRAELFEPGNEEHFTIKPSGMQEQRMIDKLSPELLFQWTVVANDAGRHPLVLNLEAVFYRGEEEIIKRIPVFTEEVFVESLPDYSWLKYAFGGLIAAIISGLFMYFRPKVKTAKVEAIIEKIGQGETAEAIKMLQAKNLSNTNENLLVNHLAEFNDIRRQFNGGLIERADMQMVVNRIHNSLLEICDELEA